jgi:hypothetical protein
MGVMGVVVSLLNSSNQWKWVINPSTATKEESRLLEAQTVPQSGL